MARYQADSDQAMAHALTVVLTHARRSTKRFEFGPLTLPELMRDGLTVVGDTDELEALLKDVPGLIESSVR